MEKEKNRTLQADLLHMEQEMRDSRIDLRIARRESKTAVEKLVKLEESANFLDSNELKVSGIIGTCNMYTETLLYQFSH